MLSFGSAKIQPVHPYNFKLTCSRFTHYLEETLYVLRDGFMFGEKNKRTEPPARHNQTADQYIFQACRVTQC